VAREEVIHHQGIMLQPVNTDPILLPEVQQVILFRQEVVIRQVLTEVHLQAAAALRHHTAADLQDLNQEDLILQDLLQVPHQAHLHQEVVAEVLLQDGDSFK
jgi:hypothetical protein